MLLHLVPVCLTRGGINAPIPDEAAQFSVVHGPAEYPGLTVRVLSGTSILVGGMRLKAGDSIERVFQDAPSVWAYVSGELVAVGPGVPVDLVTSGVESPSREQTDEALERAIARPDAPELLTVIWRALERVPNKAIQEQARQALLGITKKDGLTVVKWHYAIRATTIDLVVKGARVFRLR